MLDRRLHAGGLNGPDLGRHDRPSQERVLAEVLLLAAGVPRAVDVDDRPEHVRLAGAMKLGAEHRAVGGGVGGVPSGPEVERAGEGQAVGALAVGAVVGGAAHGEAVERKQASRRATGRLDVVTGGHRGFQALKRRLGGTAGALGVAGRRRVLQIVDDELGLAVGPELRIGPRRGLGGRQRRAGGGGDEGRLAGGAGMGALLAGGGARAAGDETGDQDGDHHEHTGEPTRTGGHRHLSLSPAAAVPPGKLLPPGTSCKPLDNGLRVPDMWCLSRRVPGRAGLSRWR